MKLVFATHNDNKLKEVQQMLPNSIELLSLTDIDCYEDIPETATTLAGNAQLKADHIASNYGYSCFADDTGLEVSALNGTPGVYSARYAGMLRDAEANMQKLLKNLKDKSDRSAQFKTVIALNLNGKQHQFEGVCKGEILHYKRGAEGFGYDPIFQPEGYTTSFAEMSLQEKNKISHRAKAIVQFIHFLKIAQF